jgi:hypothetical protein
MPDQFQLELSALLKKYGKKIVVSIQPMITDDPDQKPGPIKGGIIRRKRKHENN